MGDYTSDYDPVYALVKGLESHPGGAPVNWCKFSFNWPGPLTVAEPLYIPQVSDLSLDDQSGDDFSLATDAQGRGGAFMSAGGGRFMCCVYAGLPSAENLDPAHTGPRYMWTGASPGPDEADDPNRVTAQFGLDMTVPVFTDDSFYGSMCVPGGAGYTPPGQAAYWNFGARLLGGVGTDSIDPSVIYNGIIWQSG